MPGKRLTLKLDETRLPQLRSHQLKTCGWTKRKTKWKGSVDGEGRCEVFVDEVHELEALVDVLELK